MKSLILILTILCFQLSFEHGWAQIDPSSNLLLRSTGGSQNLDSSRYELKPREDASKAKVERVRPDVTPPVPTPTPTSAQIAQPQVAPTPVAQKTQPPVATHDLVESTQDHSDETGKIHYKDPRLNLVELDISPGLIYFDSSSQSWYRNYYGGGPVVGIDARVWLSPEFGLRTGYVTSLAADITKSPTSTAKTPADLKFFSAGFMFRHFTSNSRLSSSYTVGLGYEEDQLLVPRDETERIRIKNQILIASVSARIPTSVSHAYNLSVDIAPRFKTAEENTQAGHYSGEQKSANSVRIAWSSEYVLDKGQRIHWGFSHRLDKQIYEGTTADNDPVTGAPLTGISVQRGVTLFQVGFTWGD